MAVRLPGEKIKALVRFETDPFLGDLMASGLTGYLRIVSGDLVGMVLFQDGNVTGGYFAQSGQLLVAGVNALINIRDMCESSFEFSVSEVPEQYLGFVKILHFGRRVVDETETRLLNFKDFYKTFQKRVRNGVVTLTAKDGHLALVGIDDGKWRYVTEKEHFNQLYSAGGTRLALYEMPEQSQNDQMFSRLAKARLGEKIKNLIIASLKESFGKPAEVLVGKLSGKEITADNYTAELDQLTAYLEMFIDGKVAKPFADKINKKIELLIAEVSD